MKSIKIVNKKIILRCDFNEPIENGQLVSTKRIDANIETIQELLANKNKIILISHLSRKDDSLTPVYNYLRKIFNDIVFVKSKDIDEVGEFLNIKNDSSLILLENTRSFTNEIDESLDELNDQTFALKLSKFAETFVFDAFSVAHRNHATTIGLANLLPSCLGKNAQKELEYLSKVSDNLGKSLIFMGGAKLSTKLPLIERFVKQGAVVCVGGAMVHPIIQKKELFDIKNSLTESIEIPEDLINSSNLILPKEYVWSDDRILDNKLNWEEINSILTSNNIQNIMWNGPFGLFEKGFTGGTDEIKDFIQEISIQKSNVYTKNIYTVVGGGDTLSYLNSHPDFKCSYLSLSGGAMLDFLAKGKLDVIDVINKSI
jgi:phosphoglycerate kinase